MAFAVVFDFDGTIADTESLEFATWSSEFSARGAFLELSQWIQCVGGGEWSVMEHLESLIGPQDRQAVYASRQQRYIQASHGLEPRPGVRSLIASLAGKGVPLAVASSSVEIWVKGYLRGFGLLDCFEAVVTRDDVERVKPAPDLFLLAARRLGVPPGACTAIEDSPKGIEAAKTAGMRVIAYPNPVTESFDLSAADLTVASLEGMTHDDLLGLSQPGFPL